MAGAVGEDVIEVLLVMRTGMGNVTEEASLLAAQDVNSEPGILPNYKLRISPVYLECSPVDVIQELLDFTEKCSTYNKSVFCGRMVISGGCTVHSEVISLLSNTLNVIQTNYLPLGPFLGKSLAGENYFSLIETIDSFLFAQFAVLQALGVEETTVIIQRNPSCLDGWNVIGNYTESLFGIRTKVLFITDRFNATQTMAYLQGSFYPRNMVVCSEQSMLQLIACEAFRRSMVYPYYLWTIPDWTPAQWGMVDNSDCTAQQTRQFLDRVIAITPNYNSPQAVPKLAVPEVLDWMQFDSNALLTSVPEKLAYDSVWTVAKAVHRAEGRISPSATPEDVVFRLRTEMWALSLQGTSGLIDFVDMTGQRKTQGAIASVCIVTPNGTMIVERLADVSGSLRTSLNVTFRTDWMEIFSNGLPTLPPQFPPWYFEVSVESIILYSVAAFLAALGILYALFCMLFSLCFMNNSEIKLTSPKLNIFLGLGAICWYVSIPVGYPPWPQDPVYVTIHCELHKWLLSLGTTLVFLPLLLKTWRIYYIFHNPLKRKIALQDWKLILVLGLVVLMDLVCLSVTAAVDRWRLTAFVSEGVTTCGTDEAFLVNYIVFATFNCVYGIIGLILACQTRKIRLQGIKESPQVSLASYIFAFFLVSYVVGAYLTRKKNLLELGIVGALLFLTATLILSVIFIPKLYRIIRRNKVEESGDSFDTSEGIDGLRKATLAAMESELQQLRNELAECRSNIRRHSLASFTTRSRSRGNSALGFPQESQTNLTIIEE